MSINLDFLVSILTICFGSGKWIGELDLQRAWLTRSIKHYGQLIAIGVRMSLVFVFVYWVWVSLCFPFLKKWMTKFAKNPIQLGF